MKERSAKMLSEPLWKNRMKVMWRGDDEELQEFIGQGSTMGIRQTRR